MPDKTVTACMLSIALLSMRLRLLAAIGAAVLIVASLAGCSCANKGGETTCKEYRAMSASDQTEVIRKYLADQGKDPSNG